jgi:hypothetical protein
VAIGFGQGAGEWGVIKGTVASASGSDIRIDGRIEEGNSGGPIIMNGTVAGMVTSIKQGFGVGKSGIIVKSTLLGWDVEVSAPTTAGSSAGSSTAVVPATPTAPSEQAPSDANVGARRDGSTRRSAPSGRGAGGGPRWRSYEFPPPNAGMVVFTIMPDGNPACASYDASGCLWGVSYDQIDFTKVKPLVCGDGHRAVWGATGYEDPKHWCNLAKQVP